jgi:hypothetical protein
MKCHSMKTTFRPSFFVAHHLEGNLRHPVLQLAQLARVVSLPDQIPLLVGISGQVEELQHRLVTLVCARVHNCRDRPRY